jgi:hypothetical protein
MAWVVLSWFSLAESKNPWKDRLSQRNLRNKLLRMNKRLAQAPGKALARMQARMSPTNAGYLTKDFRNFHRRSGTSTMEDCVMHKPDAVYAVPIIVQFCAETL